MAERSLLKWLSSFAATVSCACTRFDNCTIWPSPARTKMLDKSPGVRRSTSCTCTITSYCSDPRLKRVTLRPPSRVSSVWPTVATSLPTAATLSRSTSSLSCGLSSLRSVSGLISFGFSRIFAIRRFTVWPSSSQVPVLCTTKLTGWPRKSSEPRGGGVCVKAITPGTAKNICPPSASEICLADWSRSSQSLSMVKPIVIVTSGKPTIWNTRCWSGRPLSMPSIWRAYLSVYSTVEPCGAMPIAMMKPWSSCGAVSRGNAMNRPPAPTRMATAKPMTTKRRRRAMPSKPR